MKKPGFIKRFFSFLLRVCVVLVIMAVIAVGSFEGVSYYLTGSFVNVVKMIKEETSQSASKGGTSITDTTATVDSKNMENVLIFVQGESDSKEYMALNMYDKETKVLDVLLVPANAQVSVGSSLRKEIEKKMPNVGSSLNMEDVARAYGDDKYDIMTKIMENVTGLTIAGRDVLSESDFIKVLSMAGDVSYKLDNTISYRDKDNVLKTIEADEDGNVQLDSEQAYELLTYMDGTESEESNRLERTAVYLESFFDQLLAKNNAKGIAEAYRSLCDSEKDSGITSEEDILDSISDESLTIRVMQGSESSGVFTLDSQKVKLQVSSLIKQADSYSADKSSGSTSSETDTSESGSTDGTEQDSKDCSIELYNAAYVSGLAGSWQTYLESEGYSISLIDSYQEEGPISQTRINVTEEGMGEDLLTYFPDAEITVVDEISTGGDIQVYIGTDCTNVPEVTSDGTTTDDDETDTEDDYGTDSDETDNYGTDSDETDDYGTDDYGTDESYNFDTDSQ